MRRIELLMIVWALMAIVSCRIDDPVVDPTKEDVGGDENAQIEGMFLLNEGAYGCNNCSLDYYDYKSGVFTKNIFPSRNPGVVSELGDTGNDLQIYGNRLWAVVNGSNLVEVMDVQTAKHIGSVAVPNCRYVTFKDKYAYVSSYAGPADMSLESRLGYIAKIDTATLAVVDTCVVGYQPEEMVIKGSKLYVANSGGYRYPDYDNTVSIIDLETFKETGKVEVAINLFRMELDSYGKIWVSSRGDYYMVPSMTYILDTETDTVTGCREDLPCMDMTMCGDSLYMYSSTWNYETMGYDVEYALVNVKTGLKSPLPCDPAAAGVVSPAGLAVNPTNGDIFVTDAKDYVTPGEIFCFAKDGKLKWSAVTGDVPGHMAFTTKPLK